MEFEGTGDINMYNAILESVIEASKREQEKPQLLSADEEKKLVGEVIQYSKFEALRNEGKLDLSHLKRQSPKPLEEFHMPQISSLPEKKKLLINVQAMDGPGVGTYYSNQRYQGPINLNASPNANRLSSLSG